MDSFSCSVCLEVFRDPATLPCGHTYCLRCIRSHWDGCGGVCECPQCRQRFTPRPLLSRSTVLMEAMEKLSVSHARLYPTLDHVMKDEPNTLREQLLHSIRERETALQELTHTLHTHQSAVEQLSEECKGVFSGVMRMTESCGSDVHQMLHTHGAWLCGHVEVERVRLQQQIRLKEEELQRLEANQDPVLKTPDAGSDGPPLKVWTPGTVLVDIRSALNDFRDSLENLNKNILSRVRAAVSDALVQTQAGDHPSHDSAVTSSSSVMPVSTAADGSDGDDVEKHQREARVSSAEAMSCCLSNPAPKTREEMLKYRFEPTLDPNTAFRQIRLSEGFRRATLSAETSECEEKPERFLFWRQVLCVEPLAGSPYYWEVEWSGARVSIGVAYREMPRSAADDSARLGHNTESWSLYWSGRSFSLWHAGRETALGGAKARRVGVFVDQQEGVLAFYGVAQGRAQEICCVHTHFLRPVLPGFRFWSGVGSSITICQLE